MYNSALAFRAGMVYNVGRQTDISSFGEKCMIVYHYSQTLKEGNHLEPGHQDFSDLCDPFIRALMFSKDCFYGMLLNGKYMFAVLNRSNLRYWADYAKWATEGIFEFVRRDEFQQHVSRLHCNYFCTDLSECIRMYNEDFGEETDEEQEKVHLFEVEVAESSLERRDISLFDAAYDAISENQDMDAALEYARQYFSGMHSDSPSWEFLSADEAVVVKDISYMLRK